MRNLGTQIHPNGNINCNKFGTNKSKVKFKNVNYINEKIVSNKLLNEDQIAK